jgi:hypothetical protein
MAAAFVYTPRCGVIGMIAGDVQIRPPSVVREKKVDAVFTKMYRAHARYAVPGRWGRP